MSFEMQVFANNKWGSVAPSQGEPYRYATPEEASNMLNICYGCVMSLEKRSRLRILKIDKPVNSHYPPPVAHVVEYLIVEE